MNNLANDPDTERRRTRLKRLHEQTRKLAGEFQGAGVNWREVVEAFETLEEAIAEKWEEGF